MSRFDANDGPDEHWEANLWKGQVAQAIRSKRGQAALREMRDALLAMPVRSLSEGSLATPEGDVCVLGQVYVYRREKQGVGRFRAIRALARKLNGDWMDYEEMGCWGSQEFGVEQLGLTRQIALEAAYANDERWLLNLDEEGPPKPRPPKNGEERWQVVFAWVTRNILTENRP